MQRWSGHLCSVQLMALGKICTLIILLAVPLYAFGPSRAEPDEE